MASEEKDRDGRLWWARIAFGHMGGHSGMRPLLGAFRRHWRGEVRELVPGLEVRMRALGWKVARRVGLGAVKAPWERERDAGAAYYSAASWMIEEEAERVGDGGTVFLESLEDQFWRLGRMERHPRVVAVTHQPSCWWREAGRRPEVAARADRLLALSEGMAAWWREEMGHGDVVAVRHGVDADFFRPGNERAEHDGVRLVFCGRWLRDFETLGSIISEVARAGWPVQWDLVVPGGARAEPGLSAVAGLDSVRWHSGIGDEDLRDIYRKADGLVMPLREATANNALLEAMACGLPVAVTDVGGVRDYVDPGFAALIPCGDLAGWMGFVRGLLDDPDRMAEAGQLARRHVESKLAWNVVAADIALEVGKQ